MVVWRSARWLLESLTGRKTVTRPLLRLCVLTDLMIVHDTAFEQPDNEQKGTRYWHRHTYDPCRDSVREDNVALEQKGRREDLTRILENLRTTWAPYAMFLLAYHTRWKGICSTLISILTVHNSKAINLFSLLLDQTWYGKVSAGDRREEDRVGFGWLSTHYLTLPDVYSL